MLRTTDEQSVLVFVIFLLNILISRELFNKELIIISLHIFLIFMGVFRVIALIMYNLLVPPLFPVFNDELVTIFDKFLEIVF